jgi:hypothetical protein
MRNVYSSADRKGDEICGEKLCPSAVVHVDLDSASAIFAAHGWSHSFDSDPLFETGLSNALDFLNNAAIKGTLFVIARDLEDSRKRELLREAVRQGHEIASHTLTHRKLTALNREEKRREIFESRERLSKELAVEVRGFRAPGFALDREALEMIAEAGYDYDSSLFPSASFARSVGLQNLSASPQRPLMNHQLLELPLPSHSPLPLPFHPCYSLVLGTWYFRLGLKSFRRTRAPLVMLFHLTDFADRLPENYLRNRGARLYTLSHLSGEAKRERCERMLKMVAGDYQLVPTTELLAEQSEINESNRSESQKRQAAGR